MVLPHNIGNKIVLGLVLLVGFDVGHDIGPVFGTDDQVHFLNGLNLVGGYLHITAHRHNNRVRVRAPCLAHHIAGFPVAQMGDGAGVDHIHIGVFGEPDNAVARLFKNFHHGLGVVRIYLTAKSMESDSLVVHLC
ncbi:hypothetical protein SDC9_185457 [bioreactor metagenome]|uniref:Uncharacterized protein n=1 Tax=bioreactor metagenome TaxID=1076179 RepID=A0A645HH76_9ZZZZ